MTNSDNVSELKPCPFGCTGMVYKNTTYHQDGSPFRASILCGECLLETGVFENVDEAIKFWNTRRPTDAAKGEATPPKNSMEYLEYLDWRNGNCCSGHPNCIHQPVEAKEQPCKCGCVFPDECVCKEQPPASEGVDKKDRLYRVLAPYRVQYEDGMSYKKELIDGQIKSISAIESMVRELLALPPSDRLVPLDDKASEEIESIVFRQVISNDYKTQGLGPRIAKEIVARFGRPCLSAEELAKFLCYYEHDRTDRWDALSPEEKDCCMEKAKAIAAKLGERS